MIQETYFKIRGFLHQNHKFVVKECYTPKSGLPIFLLTWFLNSYIGGLPEDVANQFMDLKVADLLKNGQDYLDKDFVKLLSSEVNNELACTNLIIAKKDNEIF